MQRAASVLLNRLLTRARFRHLQVMLQLAELGSVRRAAEAIGMSQPGVTQLLAELERLLETPLFHRHARGVRPTPAGTDLLPLARQMLQGLAAAAEATAARLGQGEGMVRVAATTAAMNGLLVQAMPLFTVAHPHVQVHLLEREVDDSLLLLARGEIDMLCCRKPAVVPEGWRFEALVPDAFVVVCGPQHPMLRKRRIALKDLAQETWLPAPAGSVARTRFDELAMQFPAPPAVCQVVTRVAAATWALLQARDLLTLVPLGVVRHLVDTGQLAVLHLQAPMPLEALGMLLPQLNASPAAATLAQFLRDVAPRLAGPAARRKQRS